MARKKRKQDWDLRTNINPGPGAQGTLFSGGKSQMSDERYPRGYTPERLNEVAKRVNPDEYSRQDGSLAENLVDESFPIRSGGSQTHHYESRQPLRDLIGTVARSTVPLEHLNGVQFNIVNGESDMGSKHSAGEYTFEDRRIDLLPSSVRDHTPIHEIGHHVSHMDGNTHAVHYDGSAAYRGQEEAFADNYAAEHARSQPRKKVDVGHYEHSEWGSNADSFETAYDQRRYGPTKPLKGMQPTLPGMPQSRLGGPR